MRALGFGGSGLSESPKDPEHPVDTGGFEYPAHRGPSHDQPQLAAVGLRTFHGHDQNADPGGITERRVAHIHDEGGLVAARRHERRPQLLSITDIDVIG